MTKPTRKLAAIMFTDIAIFTKLSSVDDTKAFPLPKDFLEHWQEQFSPYEGMMGKIEEVQN